MGSYASEALVFRTLIPCLEDVFGSDTVRHEFAWVWEYLGFQSRLHCAGLRKAYQALQNCKPKNLGTHEARSIMGLSWDYLTSQSSWNQIS